MAKTKVYIFWDRCTSLWQLTFSEKTPKWISHNLSQECHYLGATLSLYRQLICWQRLILIRCCKREKKHSLVCHCWPRLVTFCWHAPLLPPHIPPVHLSRRETRAPPICSEAISCRTRNHFMSILDTLTPPILLTVIWFNFSAINGIHCEYPVVSISMYWWENFWIVHITL